ncbi:MAG: hypothetical protein QOE33_1051 [Acidobacteriota bacterium]|nr:hypothetical protein [Acidobacteriota bacterium]
MNDADFYWLCGLLEGEGSFMKGPPSRPQYPVLSITSTDEDVIQRVGSLLGVSYCSVTKRKTHWKQSFSLRIHGRKAVDLMTRMRSHMSTRRREQIDIAVASYEARPNHGASKVSEEQIRLVKQLLRDRQTIRTIASRCKVSIWCVMRIKNHDAFPDII